MNWLSKYRGLIRKSSLLFPTEKGDITTYILRILILAAVYFAVAWAGFVFAPGRQVTAIWPAAGVALASLLIYGTHLWPGILLGSFLSKLSVHVPLWVGFSIASANTVEPVLGTWLMRRFVGESNYLNRLKGVISLWIYAALLSTFVAAIIGATTIWLSGLQPTTPYLSLFLTWWLADAGGSLVITPLILAWSQGPYSRPRQKTVNEAFVLLLLFVLGSFAAFFHPASVLGSIWIYPYMLFPLIIWCAIRFGQRGVTLMAMFIAAISFSSALFPTGPFGPMPFEQGLIIAQMFIMVVTMIGLTVSAAISECHSAQEKIEEGREYLQDVIDHIPDPLFMKNRQHILIGGNKALWALLDGPPEKFLGANCDDAFARHEEAEIFNAKYEKVFTTGETYISEETFTDKAGGKHILSVKLGPLRSRREPLLVATARDITDMKKTEERLLKYTRELENSNSELDDFAYIASHDLKEPLRGMQSFSQFLIEDYADKLDDEGKRKLEVISNLAKRLDSLLNVLLQFSRLGRTALAIGPTDIGEIVRHCITLLDISLKEKNATVEMPSDWPVVNCDRVRIAEVFQNLIGNALKYTDNKENKIEIGYTTAHPRAPGEYAFYVRDHGIGIPEKFLDSIFKIFKRLHAKEVYGGGTGSGLAIAKKIITQHGGQIWAESKGEGQGATFYFTIPQKLER